MSAKQQPKPELPYHYYASSAFNWAVASTRAEAIARVARYAGADIIKNNVKHNGGLYCWSCRVLMPESTHYTINQYVPTHIIVDGKPTGVAVPIEKDMACRIQNTRGHVIIEEKEPGE